MMYKCLQVWSMFDKKPFDPSSCFRISILRKKKHFFQDKKGNNFALLEKIALHSPGLRSISSNICICDYDRKPKPLEVEDSIEHYASS